MGACQDLCVLDKRAHCQFGPGTFAMRLEATASAENTEVEDAGLIAEVDSTFHWLDESRDLHKVCQI